MSVVSATATSIIIVWSTVLAGIVAIGTIPGWASEAEGEPVDA
jgi:hypothetical protein